MGVATGLSTASSSSSSLLLGEEEVEEAEEEVGALASGTWAAGVAEGRCQRRGMPIASWSSALMVVRTGDRGPGDLCPSTTSALYRLSTYNQLSNQASVKLSNPRNLLT